MFSDGETDEQRLQHLHREYDRAPTDELRAQLVDAYADFALALARRFQRTLEPLDDLRQVALEALLVALDRFDPRRGVPFKGFAKPTIEGALKRHYRDTGWALRVPRQVHDLAGPVRRATDALTVELGRAPTCEEVAERLGVDPDRIEEIRRATSARAVGSIDTPMRHGAGGAEPPAPDRPYERAEDHLALLDALEHLDDHERVVLQRYYVENQTQSEIASSFGVSQMQISRWINGAIARLRRYVSPDGFPTGDPRSEPPTP